MRWLPILLSLFVLQLPRAVAADAPEGTLACLQPSIAGEGRDAFLACGRGTEIFVARWENGAITGPLVSVGTLGGLALGHHRGPKIAVSGPSVVVTAIGKRGGTDHAEVWAWRSGDRGRTWSGPVRVTDVPNAAQEGLHAVAVSGSTVAVAWLDTRNGGMRLYGNRSSDGGVTWAANAEIYRSPGGAICTCCHPSLLVDDDGVVTAMFRNDVEGNRDMYLKAGSQEAVRLGDAHWRLSACPMDGGGLARTRDGRIVTAWRRDRDVVVASLESPEVVVGEGKDPALAVSGNIPVIAWQAPTGLVLRVGDAPVTPLDVAGHSPALAALGDGSIVAAWQRGEVAVVRRVTPQPAASANSASRSRARVTIDN